MMIVLYRLFFYPLLKGALSILSLFDEKIRKGLELRANHEWFASPVPTIWFHCASGEFEYAKPVIKELKARDPKIQVVVTYFSPSVLPSIQKFELIDQFGPMPLDTPKEWQKFFANVRPQMGLISRTDLWPEMLAAAKLHQVPLVLFSATVNFEGRSSLAKIWKKWLFQQLKQVFVVSPLDQQNTLSLGVPSEVLGDTRFDQAFARLQTPQKINDDKKPVSPIFVAGSTWPEDEKILFQALHRQLKDKKLYLVLVPHEPTPQHIQQIQNQLTELGLKYYTYSSNDYWNNHEVLIVDQVGILAELYGWADFAFVGGSFRKTVHSVMEPLAAGCITFLGPKMLNNREAQEFSKIQYNGKNMVAVCNSAEELTREINYWLADFLKIPVMKAQIEATTRQHQGASRRLVEKIYSQISGAGDRRL